MEFEEEGEFLAPASPGAQFLNSSALSLTVIAVFETQIAIDESLIIPHIKDVLFPLDPKFSSVMVCGKDGSRKWKRVDVNFEDHIFIPKLSRNEPPLEFYDDRITEYISNLALAKLEQSRPLWEIHMIKYPSTHGSGTIIFKLHHSLGDGHALMGLVLSGFQRVDDPMLPLRFPSQGLSNPKRPASRLKSNNNFLKKGHEYLRGFLYTLSDFGSGILKSKFLEDEPSRIRSGIEGVEFRPVVVTTMTFPIDSIKQIKDKLKVTINDVMTGIIMMGTRLYMQEGSNSSSSSNTNCNALVLLNTRALGVSGGYKSVKEMINNKSNNDNTKNNKMPSGNQFAFLHVPVPKLDSSGSFDESSNNSLKFISEAHDMIKRKRSSASVYLTGMFLDMLRRVKGPEATAEYIHGTLRNSSFTISNVIGPIDQMALAGHPIRGCYFFVAGAPQSLAILILSYMGCLRVAVVVEKDLINPNKFKSCIEKAFQTIYKDAIGSFPPKGSQ